MATVEAADMPARGAPAIPRVGIILLGSQDPIFRALRQGLNQLGYIEGQNIAFEPRAAQGQVDRIPGFAAELVRLGVAIIVATGAVSAQAARNATTKVPIVFSAVIDPVVVGFATRLERPGGNITGITSFDPQQPAKQFELLKEVFPKLSRVAILSDEDIPRAADGGLNPLERANDAAARAIGLQPQWFRVKGPTPDHESVFSAMVKEGAEALVVLEVPVNVFFHQKRIAELAAMHGLPTLFPGGWHSGEMGGLIAYGTSFHDTLPSLPRYVDKILKGAKPGELPIEVINRCELVFNLQTARAIGVMIPPELLTRADRVIE
jgi:putative ABC transport system substrate-binding protein